MIPKSVAVIGVGSLGGFIAHNLSYHKFIKQLILIDDDIVEEKNTLNSVYRMSDVGIPKVYALSSIIRANNPGIETMSFNDQYIEGKFDMPEVDLILDCRDYVYNRGTQIHARLFISSRHLVIDCRQNVSYTKNYQGKYREPLTKPDLLSVSMDFCKLIEKGSLSDFIKNRIMYKINLDDLSYAASKTVSDIQNHGVVCDHDAFKEGEKISNLSDTFYPLVKENKETKLHVHLDSVENPTLTKVIEKNEITGYKELAQLLNPLISTPLDHQQYFIEIVKVDGKTVVVLLPETGGA